VVDRLGLAQHLAALGQELDGTCLGLLDRLAGDLGEVGDTTCAYDRVGRVGDDASVASDNGPRWQDQLAPPRDVGRVTERADHRNTGALVGLGEGMGENRNLDIEQRRADGRVEIRLVTVVVGVGHEGDAGRKQFRSGCLDDEIAAAIGLVECDRVISRRAFPFLEFRLRDGGLEVDVPQRRGVLAVGLAPGKVAQEGALRGAT
jgi:hypothetical protein